MFGDGRAVGVIDTHDTLARTPFGHQRCEVRSICGLQVRCVGESTAHGHHAGKSETDGNLNIGTQEFIERPRNDVGRRATRR